MNRAVVSLCAALALIGLGLAATSAGDDNRAMVERGRYLVEFAGCGDCHTPMTMGPHGPQHDAARMYSGHPSGAGLPPPPVLPPGPWNAITGGMTAWAGPWGISYAINLTSDKGTGLGAWDESMFVAALQTGKHLGMGRDILPPMPHYSTASNEDLKAIFAYLMTVPPISNEVPEPVPPAAAAGT